MKTQEKVTFVQATTTSFEKVINASLLQQRGSIQIDSRQIDRQIVDRQIDRQQIDRQMAQKSGGNI